MSYYHIRIDWIDETDGYQYRNDINFNEGQVTELAYKINNGLRIFFCHNRIDSTTIERVEIWKTDGDASNKVTDWTWITSNGKDVTKDFIKHIPEKKMENIENAVSISKGTITTPSKNVFIVHGREHEPMKELKAMLLEFGLNPIVLHEQPSGSRTIVENLEKYSDVGYAFVILTPEDSAFANVTRKTISQLGIKIRVKLWENECSTTELEVARNSVKELLQMLESLKDRARQNVVLEFGYFMGLLGRDRVCCLYKGEIELPSDMHGIVYVPFKEFVKERRNMIIKELREAGYDLKT